MITARQVFRNSIWSSLSFGINFGIGIIFTLLLPSILGTEEYGRYGYYFRIYIWIMSFSTLFVPQAVLRYGAELLGQQNYQHLRKLLIVGYKYQLAISLLMTFGGLLYLSLSEFNDSNYIIASMLVLLSGFISGFHNVGRSYLEANQQFRLFSRITAWSAIAKLTTLIVVYFSGANKACWFFLIILVENLSLFLFLLYSHCLSTAKSDSNKETQESEFAKDFSKRLFNYGMTMGLAGLFSIVSWGYIEVFLIKYLYINEDMLTELSFYCFAVSISALMVRMLRNVTKPLLTFFVHYKVSDRSDVVEKGFVKSLIVFTITGGAGCVFLYLFSEELFSYVFPANMLKAKEPFLILLIPSLLMCISMPISPLLQAYEEHKFLLWLNVFAAIANIALDIYLIPRYGAIGAAIVNCLVQSLTILMSMFYQHYKKMIVIPFYNITKIVFCFLLLIVIVNLSKVCLGVIVSLILAVLTYILLLFIFRIIAIDFTNRRLVLNAG